LAVVVFNDMSSPTIRRLIGESTSQPKEIIFKDKVIPGGMQVCPHCMEEIHEKGVGFRQESQEFFHGKCGGEIRYPHPSQKQIETMERAWGVRYYPETRKYVALVREKGTDRLYDPATGL
jgi:hypothetical protein